MIWVLLGALGVPLWLLAGGLLLAFCSRRRFQRRPTAFECRIRPAGPVEKNAGWSRGKRNAYWVHDVLLVHRGFALVRHDTLPVASIAGPVVGTSVKGFGERPISLRLHLDDGRLFDIAARNVDVAVTTGPFVTASMR